MYDWLVLSAPPTGGSGQPPRNPSRESKRRLAPRPHSHTPGGAVSKEINGTRGSSVSELVHLLHVAVGGRCTLRARVGEKVRGHLRGQGGRSFRVQVGPEERLAGGLQENKQPCESWTAVGLKGIRERESM